MSFSIRPFLGIASACLGFVLATLLSTTSLSAACTGTATSATCTSTGPANGLTAVGGTFPQKATIYPSGNAVSGLSGTIASIQVRLNGLTHTDPDDLDMVLVAPDGRSFVFWSDIGSVRLTNTACPTAPFACSVNNFTITVADSSTTLLPDGNGALNQDARVLVNNTTYKPTNNGVGADVFPDSGVTVTAANSAANVSTVAGLGGTATFASTFNGSGNINGEWKLYIALDSCCGPTGSDTGTLTSWSLIITTNVAVAPTTTSLTSTTNPSLVGNNATFTATITSGGNPVTLGSVTFSDGGTTLATNVALNSSGQATLATAALSEGAHNITAVYSGATGFGISNGSLTHVVDRPTTISGNTFCNVGPITIPNAANAAATPYPSKIFVTGLAGSTQKITLDLKNFTHPIPDDVDLLLVSPTGQRYVPFASVAGLVAVNNINLTLDDAAGTLLPSTGALAAGTYRPSAFGSPTFLSPAPAGPYQFAAPTGSATFIDTFSGTSPNGTWQLFAVSRGSNVAGTRQFGGGWCLNISTSSAPATITTPSVSPSPSFLNQQVTMSALVTNATTNAPVNAQGTLSFSGLPNFISLPFPVNDTGTVSLTPFLTTEGAFFITANYNGSPGNFALSSGTALHYVDAFTTGTPPTFCNSSEVTFPNVVNASGAPYPTRVRVGGLAGTVNKVTISLNGLSHQFPDDLDLMLSGPNGNSLILLSDVGGGTAINGLNLVLDSTAVAALPDGTALTSGTFRPGDFQVGADSFAAPAPTTNVFSASNTTLATAFANSDPNGYWTLFTRNDGAGAQGGGTLSGGWCLNVTMNNPELSISKTHTGNFTQGQQGAEFKIVVGNNGPGTTAGTITVTNAQSPGITLTGLSGSGWTCNVGSATCTTTAIIGAGDTFPEITATVNVAANATSPNNSSATVSGSYDPAGSLKSASDTVVINGAADLAVIKDSASSFALNGTATYSLFVRNVGAGPTVGNYTLTDNLPTGLTVASLALGVGWDCSLSTATTVSCVRSVALAAGTTAPTVLVNVAISPTTPASITNTAVVAGGGQLNLQNDSGSHTATVGQPPPDLTISKSHVGNFNAGSTGNTYTVVVTNSGTAAKPEGSLVTVIDSPTVGLTITSISGPGWSCATFTNCTRIDALAAGASYPPITVTVSVPADAAASQTNSVVVQLSGSEANTNNNSAADPTTIIPIAPPDVTISKSHIGNFNAGSTGNTYTVVVTNSGAGPKPANSSVTVIDSPTPGLTITAISGPGWSCATFTNCTRTDALAAGASYPPITVTVSVAADAAATQTNSVVVQLSGSEANTNNNSAADPTTIIPIAPPDVTISKSHIGNFNAGSTGNTYTVVVTNSGAGPKPANSSVTVIDSPTSGLAITAISGPGWSCATFTNCTRTDALAAGASYPPITVTVSVPADAAASQTNSVAVQLSGTEANTNNNSAADPTTIIPVALPDLTISKSHIGNFTAGSTGNTYTVVVTNSGAGAMPPSVVTVIDSPTVGLTLAGISGPGWSCGTISTCTRVDGLAAGASYPPITVTVNVPANAAASQSNSVVVQSSGTEANTNNNSAADPTTVVSGTQAVTINVPPGVSFSLNNGNYTGSQTVNLPAGSYLLSTTALQPLGGGTRAQFVNWSDGGALAHNITVGASPITITGNFTTQYQLTISASAGGNVTPASGTFFDAGTVVNVTATPLPNFNFVNWTGLVANANAAATTVTMSTRQTVTANFTASAQGVTIVVPAGISFTFNNITYTGTQTLSLVPGTYPLSTTSPQTLAPGTRAVFGSWSDAGAISHLITLGASPITITGNFATQHQLTTVAGAGGAVTPASGAFFDAGTLVNITASAAPGFNFVSWLGPVANPSSAATTVTMSAPRTVTANFAAANTTLNAVISSKSGPANARVWNITLQNTGAGAAVNAQLGSLALVQTFGPACTPIVSTALPASAGTIAPGVSTAVPVTINFASCSLTSRFRVDLNYTANAGATVGSKSISNQFQ